MSISIEGFVLDNAAPRETMLANVGFRQDRTSELFSRIGRLVPDSALARTNPDSPAYPPLLASTPPAAAPAAA
jgi:hypothetical protein